MIGRLIDGFYGRVDYRWLRLLAVVWMGLIFFLSSRPTLPVEPVLWAQQDKVFHFLAYGLLGGLLGGAIGPWRGGLSLKQAVAVVLMAGLYGATDEFHQSFVPGRDASIADWVADVAGATAAAWWLSRRKGGAPGR